jgi:prevent-host-death family protein
MQTVSIQQAQHRLYELIHSTIHGDDVLITEHGEPVVKLVAVKRHGKFRKFGSAKGLIRIAEDFDEPLEDFQEYR